VTPRASELEQSDFDYLAPAISSQGADKMVPTTAAASRALDKQERAAPAVPPPVETALPGATKFAEGGSAHPSFTPDSSPPAPISGHMRSGSASSSGGLSSGSGNGSAGSPRRRVTLANRIKGEAKVIKGKLTKNQAKVHEGRVLLGDEQ
jgi:hypothetical protein